MAKVSSSNAGVTLGEGHSGSLHRDPHLDFKTDYELANRLCCILKWAGEELHDHKHLAASPCQTLGCIA